MLKLQRFFPQNRNKPQLSQNHIHEIERMDTALRLMVNLRHKVDFRIKNGKKAEHWPLCAVWETPEALIANAVELCETLKDDGYTEAESIQKFLLNRSLSKEGCADLISYLKFRLETVDPTYLSFNILDQAVTLAKIGAKIEIEKRKKGSYFPPPEWLKERLTFEELMDDSIYDTVIDQKPRIVIGNSIAKNSIAKIRKNQRYALLPSSRNKNKDWVRFQFRMRPEDEIWTFSGSLLQNGTSLRAGVALIRDEKTIDRVITWIG